MGTGRSAVGEPLGRNLTFGMLDSLGSAIVAGAYDPEAFPTEAGLSRQYNVSRSVTRLAVKMLSAKGLLSARPRQGVAMQPTARWNKFDPDVLRWMLSLGTSVELLIQFDQLRLAIEPEAASLAASRADRRDARLLADALSRSCGRCPGDRRSPCRLPYRGALYIGKPDVRAISGPYPHRAAFSGAAGKRFCAGHSRCSELYRGQRRYREE